MWQRFTERARRIVFFAQEEAVALGGNFVYPEHLLLGLLRERENDSAAARILTGLGVSLGEVRSMIELQVARGEGRTGEDMQLAPRAKRVIDLAYDEARRLNSDYIGTEHILLGLIREAEGLAGRVLSHFQVDLDQARLQVLKIKDESNTSKVNETLLPVGKEYSEPPQLGSPSVVPPSAGDLGRLISPEGRSGVEVALDAAAVSELKDVFLARDGYGYQELLDLGRVFVAATGERVKNLVLPRDGDGNAAPESTLFVRILDGVHEGRKGWISADTFALLGPDDTPFPPEESSLTLNPDDEIL
jgi:hypothetical protein